MSITPQAAAKLGQSRSQNPSIATSVDGLTVGDRGYIQSTLEGVISNAIGGSQKMGGSDGLLDKIDFQLSKFSYEIRAEVKSLFTSLVGQLSSKNDDNEEVKIDEKQFKEMQSDSVNEIFNGGLTKKITSQFKDKVGSFLKGNFITSVFKNKTFKGITDKISQASIYVKTAVGGFIKNIGPKLISYINTSIAYMKTSFKYMVTVGKTMGKISKAIGTIIWRLGSMFVMAAIRFAIFIAALALQTIMIISSIVGSLIVFLTPIALTIASMALGVLFIAGVVFLILFAFYLLYNFVKTWLDVGFSKAVKELFSSGAIAKAFEQTLTLLESSLGLKEGTLLNVFSYLYNLDFIKLINDFVSDMGGDVIKSLFDKLSVWFMEKAEDLGKRMIKGFTIIYETTIKPWLDPTIKFISEIWGYISNVWNWLKGIPVIGPLVTWLEDTFMSGWKYVTDLLIAVADWAGLGASEDLRKAEQIMNRGIQATSLITDDERKLMSSQKSAFDMLTKALSLKGYTAEQQRIVWLQLDQPSGDASDNSVYINAAKKILESSGLVKFATGGIATKSMFAALGEAGDSEAVIPLNAQGAKFLAATMEQAGISNIPMSPSNVETIKGIMESVIAEESKSESGSEAVHAKLDMVIGQMRDRQGNNATIVSSDDTSNFIDMIAKGMFE